VKLNLKNSRVRNRVLKKRFYSGWGGIEVLVIKWIEALIKGAKRGQRKNWGKSCSDKKKNPEGD